MINKKLIIGSILMVSAISLMTIKSEAAELGDVNGDGYINSIDASKVFSIMRDSEGFDEEVKEAADVDKNGQINNRDARIILQYAARGGAGNVSSMDELVEEINKSKGDVNGDGKVDYDDVFALDDKIEYGNGNYYSLNADIDEDGEVTEIDSMLLMERIVGIFEEGEEKELGDVNEDGLINSVDAAQILAMIENKEEYKAVADVNKDGEINKYDAQIILIYAARRGAGFDDTLEEIAEEEKKDTVMEFDENIGDINGDGKINAVDAAQILAIIENGEEYKEEADIDKNGEVDIIDAKIVLQYAEFLLQSYLDRIEAGEDITVEDILKELEENRTIIEDIIKEVKTDYTIDKLIEGIKEKIGDVNGDGIVDKEDALLVLTIEKNKEGYKPEADVDKNGEVNKRDAQLILTYASRIGAGIDCTLNEVVEDANNNLGDVNKDGEITISDGSAILRLCISQTTSYNILADVNCDGKITTSDVLLLLYYLRDASEPYKYMTLYEFVKSLESLRVENSGDIGEAEEAENENTYSSEQYTNLGDYIIKVDEEGAMPALTKEQLEKAIDVCYDGEVRDNCISIIDTCISIQDEYKINAAFPIAVAMMETRMGTALENIAPDTYNMYSIREMREGGYIDQYGWAWKIYTSYSEATEEFGKIIAEKYFPNFLTVDAVSTRYASGSSRGRWTEIVKENLDKIFASVIGIVEEPNAEGYTKTYTYAGHTYKLFKQYNYKESYGTGTIANSGDGLVAIATVVSAFKSEENPVTIRDACVEKYGYRYTYSDRIVFADWLGEYGLTSAKSFTDVRNSESEEEIINHLKSGMPVIMNMGGTLKLNDGQEHSYEIGHFVALLGVDAKGNIFVSDSAGSDRDGFTTFENLRNAAGSKSYRGAYILVDEL